MSSSLTREMSVGLDRQSTVPPDDPRVQMSNPTPPGPVGEQLSAKEGAVTVPKTFRVRELRLFADARETERVAHGRCLFVLVQMNRNSTFKRFMSGLPGWREGEPGERVQLGHWDVYKTHTNNAQYDSWPRSCTNCLDNIWTYYRRVCTLLFAIATTAHSVHQFIRRPACARQLISVCRRTSQRPSLSGAA